MGKELTIFDDPKNVQRVLQLLFTSLFVLLVVDFFIDKHAYFPWEGAPEFHAVYGFVACVALVFIARGLRAVVGREEDYYD